MRSTTQQPGNPTAHREHRPGCRTWSNGEKAGRADPAINWRSIQQIALSWFTGIGRVVALFLVGTVKGSRLELPYRAGFMERMSAIRGSCKHKVILIF